jgi:hypothetical protein
MESWGREIYRTLQKIDSDKVLARDYRKYGISPTVLAMCQERGLVEIYDEIQLYTLTKSGRDILFDLRVAREAVRCALKQGPLGYLDSSSADGAMQYIDIIPVSVAGQIVSKVVVTKPKFANQFQYKIERDERVRAERERMEKIADSHRTIMIRKIRKKLGRGEEMENERKPEEKISQYLNV